MRIVEARGHGIRKMTIFIQVHCIKRAFEAGIGQGIRKAWGTLLLKILALGPMNGFAVRQRLKQVSGDVLQIDPMVTLRYEWLTQMF